MELKQRIFLIIAVCAFCLLFLGTGLVKSDTMPNVFQSGQIANAADVNENFQYLLNRVHSYNVNFDGVSYGWSGYTYGAIMSIIRYDREFMFNIYPNGTASKTQSFYKNNSCTGQIYFKIADSETTAFLFTGRPGILFDIGGALYYSGKDSQLYKFESLSYKYLDKCYQSVSTSIFVKAFVNAPNITGVNSYPVQNITIDGLSESVIFDE